MHDNTKWALKIDFLQFLISDIRLSNMIIVNQCDFYLIDYERFIMIIMLLK